MPCAGLGDLMQDRDQEQTAKYLCHTCPRMYACREWAVRTDVDGVCGGLTVSERQTWRAHTGVRLEPLPRNLPLGVLYRDEHRSDRPGHDELLDQIDAARHESAADIGERIGLSQRGVVRLRAAAARRTRASA